MANKKNNRRKPAPRGGRKGEPEVFGLWRLSLIVFAIVCFRLLEFADIRTFEFVRTIRDAWGVADYNINFIMLGVSLAGLLMLLFSKPHNTLRVMFGGVMTLIPVWLRTEDFAGGIGARAVTLNGIEPLALLFSISAVLWCFCMLHGADSRLQLLTGAILIGANIALCIMPNFPIDWWQLVTIDAFAILLGLSMDLAYNGFKPATLLPVIAIAVEFMLRYGDVDSVTTAYATIGVCGLGLLMLVSMANWRRGSAGTAVTLAGIAVNALSILFLNGLLL